MSITLGTERGGHGASCRSTGAPAKGWGPGCGLDCICKGDSEKVGAGM